MFCRIGAGDEPAELIAEWSDAVAFVPHHPVVDGHILVIPKVHVDDVTRDPNITAAVMARVAEYATPPCNVITSAGAAATQTVFHMHVHVVPRHEGDGLRLPWTTD